VVDLFALGGVRLEAFDFSGTGATAETDADPTRYEIDTATLALPGLAANDVVRVRGLVNAFASAPPDFVARTVIDVDTQPAGALLWASWMHDGGTAEPFAGVSADRIDIDLSQARHTLALFDRVIPVPGDAIALVAPDSGQGIYVVAVRGTRQMRVYSDFASLTTALSQRLTAGNRLTQIGAYGRYNAAAVEMTTPRASFEFTTP
jgi:hypothetical protein